MILDMPQTGLQIRSCVTAAGTLTLSLISVPLRPLDADEVLMRIEAAPINPSDLGLLIGPADMATATILGTVERPVVTATIPDTLRQTVSARVDQSLPVGNEGAGAIVAAGTSATAQALLGKTVAAFGGAMFAQYRILKAADCLPLPSGTTAAEGASCFVNPLTALGMVETMRREGYSALVHTAAASNLGQMLNRLCIAEGISLVNIVRSEGQANLLRNDGARYVCNSTSCDFEAELTVALAATGATLAFDAIGGGRLASQIISAMETAANQTAAAYSRYGSATHKQVYMYGRLNTGLVELNRGTFGTAWGVGGWLLPPFLQKVGPDAVKSMQSRVAYGLKTIFVSQYTREISLAEALQLQVISDYSRRATGEKFLINPSRSHGA